MLLKKLFYTALILVLANNVSKADSLPRPVGDVGILLMKDPNVGYPIIKEVVPGSPADKAGLKAGEALLKINGDLMYMKPLFFVTNMLKGAWGTQVKLEIWNHGKELNFDILRDIFKYTAPQTPVADNQQSDESKKICDSLKENLFGKIGSFQQPVEDTVSSTSQGSPYKYLSDTPVQLYDAEKK